MPPAIQKKIVIINNGVDLNKFPLTNQQRSDQEIKKIIFVGLIKPRKGIIESIKALKCYFDEYHRPFLYEIIGSYDQNDRYARQIMSLIKEYGMENQIIMTGKIAEEKLRQAYRTADLFLMLPITHKNRFEGFGLVYLEANSQGAPCIGSLDSGAEDAIIDGKTGFLVNPLDTKETAKKIDLILNQKMISRQDCLDWAQSNNVKIKIKQIMELYKK